MQHTNLDHLSVEARGEIMEGALAYHALKTEHHDYHHWVRVGKAIVQLRRAAAAEAGVDTNSLKQPRLPCRLQTADPHRGGGRVGGN
jgi:hypothetical protein